MCPSILAHELHQTLLYRSARGSVTAGDSGYDAANKKDDSWLTVPPVIVIATVVNKNVLDR